MALFTCSWHPFLPSFCWCGQEKCAVTMKMLYRLHLYHQFQLAMSTTCCPDKRYRPRYRMKKQQVWFFPKNLLQWKKGIKKRQTNRLVGNPSAHVSFFSTWISWFWTLASIQRVAVSKSCIAIDDSNMNFLRCHRVV